MDNTIDHTFESANRVYDKNQLCPTIPTCGGGNIQPKVIEETKCVGGLSESKWGDKQYHQQDRVYKGDIALALPANLPDGSYKYIVAMRGRNPEHPTDRTPGIHTEQRLEMNKDGLVNTLTTVQKDNLLLESKTIRMVRTEEVKEKMKNIVIDIYNNKIIDDKVCGTITAHGNASSTTCGTFGIVEKEKINKVGQISNEGSQCGTVVSDEGLAPILSAGTHGYANAHVCTKYRIRKLTPKECWRLMGYTDTDFEKAAEVNSNTQLYRESGNAIVKQVMMAIFLQMGIKGLKKWEERSKEEKAELIRGSIYDKADFQ